MIKKIKLSILTLFLALAPILFTVHTANVSAASPFSGSISDACEGANLGGGGGCDKKAQEKKVNSVIEVAINILSVIVGIAAVIMIIVSGFRFITSGGDSNSISSARNGVIYAVIGLALVAIAQTLVKYVIDRL